MNVIELGATVRGNSLADGCFQTNLMLKHLDLRGAHPKSLARPPVVLWWREARVRDAQ